MSRMLRFAALAVAAAVLCMNPASAQCPISQVFGHQLGGWVEGCSDGTPVAAFAYGLNSTGVASTRLANFVCEADGEASQGSGNCVGAGALGDGIITIDGNWLNPGVTGCPNTAGVRGVGRNVIAILDNHGGGLIVSVGYELNFAGYPVEYAGPADFGPLHCRDASGGTSRGVTGVNVTTTGDTTTTSAVWSAQAVAPRIISDCDPGSLDETNPPEFKTCTEGAMPTVAAGKIYTNIADCRASTLDLRTILGGWTAEVTATDGRANSTRSYPSGSCLFIGSTATIGGVESPGILSAVAIAGALAASPRALEVRAKHAGGDVLVSWRTDTEVGLAGFTIETAGGKQIGGMIAPKGGGGAGASYSATLKRGDFKNEKSLYVISLTSDGKVKSDLASF